MENWNLEASSQAGVSLGSPHPCPQLAWSYQFLKGARMAVNSR